MSDLPSFPDRIFAVGPEISLSDYLKKRITTGQFFSVAEQITGALERCRGEGLQIDLDIRNMTVIPKIFCGRDEVQFQTAMEDSVYEVEHIKAFLKELAFASVFDTNQNCGEITSFLQFLDNPRESGSFQKIRDYICNAMGISPARRRPQYHPPQSAASEDDTGVLDPDFWSRIEEQHRRKTSQGQESQAVQEVRTDRRQPGEEPPPQSAGEGRSVEGGRVIRQSGEEQPRDGQVTQSSPGGNETGVLDSGFWDQALKNTPSTRLPGQGGGQKQKVYGKLTHIKSGRTVPVTMDYFWIGKERVDFRIDRDVVSRRHAVLVSKDGHHYIIDNNSTNKTYVDGREILPRVSEEIFNGTKLKFADEEYIFEECPM